MCKCGAETFEDHLKKVESGEMGPHVYTGFIWLPEQDSWYNNPSGSWESDKLNCSD